MKLKVTIGDVIIEYTEPTDSSRYPACFSLDKSSTSEKTKHDVVIALITGVVNSAVLAYNERHE